MRRTVRNKKREVRSKLELDLPLNWHPHRAYQPKIDVMVFVLQLLLPFSGFSVNRQSNHIRQS